MRNLDELGFRDWAGCTASDDPDCHGLADSGPLTAIQPHRWPQSAIDCLTRLLGGANDKTNDRRK